jgi:hypothetical protein
MNEMKDECCDVRCERLIVGCTALRAIIWRWMEVGTHTLGCT